MGKKLSVDEIELKYYYDGSDLGCTYTKSETAFRLWAPTAVYVKLNLYQEGSGDNCIKQLKMKNEDNGTFYLKVPGNLEGLYYTYQVTHKDIIHEVTDPYARAVGVNGERGMILNLDSTNPKDWNEDKKPFLLNPTDAVIYELHVRDLSSDPSSHIKNIGKFLGIIESGTVNNQGLSTGLDHMKELGITHLHLLPSFDYNSVDETKLEENQFNWGYDPRNYNVPEGSYSTDPYHGEVRIKEFKQMVQELHRNGIRVILDVVYNHTALSEDSHFNCIVPGYYYRMKDGVFSNGSACGNETASERQMMRKYIVDSVRYWADEYHLDGFRFDLMGLHDIGTMKQIRAELDKIDCTILMYGEGWTGGASVLSEEESASKKNTFRMEGIASFSDDMRDSVKGSVFAFHEPGFVNGGKGFEEKLKFSIVGGIAHKQLDCCIPWASDPMQAVNYVSAHDDLSLWDKLTLSTSNASLKNRIKMNKLAASIVLTSQGIPFLQAGEEILRSKPGTESGMQFDSNSYRSSDKINSIKWDTKTDNIDIFHYYQGLIEFRKAHPALRMTTQQEVESCLTFFEGLEKNVVAYHITGQPNGEKAEEICVVLNARRKVTSVRIPNGEWHICIDEKEAGSKVIRLFSGDTLRVPAISAIVLIR